MTILDIIFLLGLAAIAFGAGLVLLPAGFIVGGALTVATVVMVKRGELRAANPGGDA